ncbi:hypothetical protein IQ277_19930 [Nostocales cyanobacterium LEGE 12452]|nr:hypothetical protein [Nostocales cyanobacterium LEGE 12452]
MAEWDVYGFARTYIPAMFKTRIIDNLPSNYYAKIYKVIVDVKPVPDIKKIYHQALVNAEIKALVIVKS